MTRLFVTRLAPFTRKKDLLRVFQRFGAEHAVIIQRGTGNVAFVTFKTPEGAAAALAEAEGLGIFCKKRKLRLLVADAWHNRDQSSFSGEREEEVDPFDGLLIGSSSILPIECISMIAKYLPYKDRATMERVSRSWRLGSLASHCGTREITLSDWRWPADWNSKRISTDSFYWFVKRVGSYLRSVTIDDESLSANLKPQVLSIMIRNCPNLRAINLAATTIRPTAIRDLAEISPKIIHLTLGKCDGPVDPDLSTILENANRLETIQFVNTGVVGKSLYSLNKSISGMVFNRCNSLRTDHLAVALLRCDNLTSIHIVGCESINYSSIFQAITLNELLSKTLQTLALHVPVEINDEDPVEFIGLNEEPVEGANLFPSKFVNLSHLTLTFSSWVTSEFIRELGQHMRNLSHLDISGCTNLGREDDLHSLSQLPNLKILKINYLRPTMTEVFLQDLGSLEELHARDNLGLTDGSVCALIRHSSHIKTIDIEGCPNISIATLEGASSGLRGTNRTDPLYLYVGRTQITRHLRFRQNLYLRVIYNSIYPVL